MQGVCVYVWHYDTKRVKQFGSIRDFKGDPVVINTDTLEHQCRSLGDKSSKVKTYLSMNPDLCVHSIYQTKNEYIPDYKRINFTRFRVSAHRLRIESGRWSRTPREQRLCTCGLDIQDEAHVVFYCPLTKHIRDKYLIRENIIDWSNMFNLDNQEICELLTKILTVFT